MDRFPDEHVSDLTSQVAELRAVNNELGRALAAADAGTPLRSSITAALTLSRVEDAEQAAAMARMELEAAVADRDAAVAERDRVAIELQELRRVLADQAAELSRRTDELAAVNRTIHLAFTERDSAHASLECASAELERLRSMLSRRSVRTAQRAARAATPLFGTARRLRGRRTASAANTR